MSERFEALWEQVGPEAEPAGLELRRDFLLANVGGGERVLDLGCGAGELTVALARAGCAVVGADVAEEALRRARARDARLELVRVPYDGPLPFADGAFEVVWAGEVIERVADTAAWLSEVRRVLAPRGHLLLSATYHGRVKDALLALAGGDPGRDPLSDRLHSYRVARLRELLAGFGFDEISVRAAGGAPLLRRTILARARRAPLGAGA